MFDFIMGGILGFAAGMVLMGIAYKEGKWDCEESLPRDQGCVISWEVYSGDA